MCGGAGVWHGSGKEMRLKSGSMCLAWPRTWAAEMQILSLWQIVLRKLTFKLSIISAAAGVKVVILWAGVPGRIGVRTAPNSFCCFFCFFFIFANQNARVFSNRVHWIMPKNYF